MTRLQGIICLVFLCLYIPVCVQAQQPALDWVVPATDEWPLLGETSVTDLVTDPQGRLYVTGNFQGLADLDPGTGTDYHQTAGGQDVFVACYAPDGSLRWAFTLGGTGTESAKALDRDSLGNIWFLGDYNTASLNLGSMSLNNHGMYDACLLKLDSNGTLLDAATIGTATDDYGRDIEIMHGTEPVICGTFRGTLDFDPGPGTLSITSTASQDVFLARFTGSLGCIWARAFGNTAQESMDRLYVSESHRIYATGYYQVSPDFDFGAGTVYLNATATADGYYAVWDENATLLLARHLPTTTAMYGRDIVVDTVGNVYVTGSFTGTADMDFAGPIPALTAAAGTDIFTASFDSTGAYRWGHALGNTSNDNGRRIVLQPGDLLTLAGNFIGTVDFDPGPGTVSLAAGSMDDVCLVTYTRSGNFVRAVNAGNTQVQTTNALVYTPAGSLVYGGVFTGTLDFDPGAGVANGITNGAPSGFVSALADTLTYQWAQAYTTGASVLYDQVWNAICRPASGDIWVTGGLSGKTDLQAGAGTAFYTSQGNTDAVVAHYTDAGLLLDYVAITGTGAETGVDVARDAAGNLYVTGTHSGGADFDPGPGTLTFPTNGGADAFIARYNAAGALVFAGSFGGALNEQPVKVLAAQDGYIYLSGIFNGTLDMDLGPGVTNLVATNASTYLAKYDTLGQLIWARMLAGASSNAFVKDATLAPDGSLCLVGSFSGTVDFDLGAGVQNGVSNASSYDAWIARYSPAADLRWYAVLGNAGTEEGAAIVADASGGLFATGYFRGTVDFDPGPGTASMTSVSSTVYSAWILSLDTSAAFRWVKALNQVTGAVAPKDLSLSTQGSLQLAGDFWGGMDADPGPGAASMITSNTNGFVVCLDAAAGTYRYHFFSSSPNLNRCNAVAGMPDGGAVTAGEFRLQTDFDPSVAVNAPPVYSSADAYLARYTLCTPTASSTSQSACVSYFWPLSGQTYHTSGAYTAILANAQGCDSVITLNLTLLPASASYVIDTVCGAYTWSANGQTYTQSGAYTATLTNAVGCDSFLTLELVVRPIKTDTLSLTTCDAWTWPLNGQTYTASGYYTEVFTMATGCDSLVTLDLHLLSRTYGPVDTVEACQFYFWPENQVTYTQSGLYSTALVNAAGCDSVRSIFLTVHPAQTQTQAVHACSWYVWPLTQQAYTASGQYTVTRTQSSGCDSVYVLDLSLYQIDTTVVDQGAQLMAFYAGGTYTWIDCSTGQAVPGGNARTFTPPAPGTYAVVVQDGPGGQCQDTSGCHTVLFTATGPEPTASALPFLYPNPNSGDFFLDVQAWAGSLHCRITDLAGQVLSQSQIPGGSIAAFTSHLPAGMYFLDIQHEQSHFHIRFTVQ